MNQYALLQEHVLRIPSLREFRVVICQTNHS